MALPFLLGILAPALAAGAKAGFAAKVLTANPSEDQIVGVAGVDGEPLFLDKTGVAHLMYHLNYNPLVNEELRPEDAEGAPGNLIPMETLQRQSDLNKVRRVGKARRETYKSMEKDHTLSPFQRGLQRSLYKADKVRLEEAEERAELVLKSSK